MTSTMGDLRSALAMGDLRGIQLDVARASEWKEYLRRVPTKVLLTGATETWGDPWYIQFAGHWFNPQPDVPTAPMGVRVCGMPWLYVGSMRRVQQEFVLPLRRDALRTLPYHGRRNLRRRPYEKPAQFVHAMERYLEGAVKWSHVQRVGVEVRRRWPRGPLELACVLDPRPREVLSCHRDWGFRSWGKYMLQPCIKTPDWRSHLIDLGRAQDRIER